MKTVELLDVISVLAKDDFTLILTFENKTVRVFDMAPLLNKRPFQRLQNIAIFKQAQIEYGTVVWPGNIDIAPETLWDQSTPII